MNYKYARHDFALTGYQTHVRIQERLVRKQPEWREARTEYIVKVREFGKDKKWKRWTSNAFESMTGASYSILNMLNAGDVGK